MVWICSRRNCGTGKAKEWASKNRRLTIYQEKPAGFRETPQKRQASPSVGFAAAESESRNPKGSD